jgi:hypothetical protein
MQSLVAIEQRAFFEFAGEIVLLGQTPMLTQIGFRTFHSAKNPLNVINLECVSLNGLTFLEDMDEDLNEDALAFEYQRLEEIAFRNYNGQQNMDPAPPGCIECWEDAYTGSEKCTSTTTITTTTALAVSTTLAAEATYTCDEALGDVPLTKARYASIQAGELRDGFAAVTCIPPEEFAEFDTSLIIGTIGSWVSGSNIGQNSSSKLGVRGGMPNLVSIGERAFFRFKGDSFHFLHDDGSLPRLKHIGAEAFAEFDFNSVTRAVIKMKGLPSLLSIGDRAFQTFNAYFMLLEVECACSNLEVIGDAAFTTVALANTSRISFSDLSRLRFIGASAFHGLSDGSLTERHHSVILKGVTPLLTIIGTNAFR